MMDKSKVVEAVYAGCESCVGVDFFIGLIGGTVFFGAIICYLIKKQGD